MTQASAVNAVGVTAGTGGAGGASASPQAARFAPPGMTVLAFGLAIGIAIGWNGQEIPASRWLAIAAGFLVAALVTRRWGGIAALMFLTCSMAAAGAGWVTIRTKFVAPDDLAAYVGDEAMLVRVRGVALQAPTLRPRTAGSMAKFDYRDQATYFPIRIDALLDRHGVPAAIYSNALIRVNGTVAPFRAGDHVEAMGFLMRPPRPRNPGEFDFREYARSLGQAGVITVEDRNLLKIVAAERNTIVSAYLNWRDDLRRRSSAWLLSNLPESGRSQRDLLLTNILLGEREEQIDGFSDSFQRVGLAHVLAISGFHLSVLAGFVLLAARAVSGHQRWHGWLIIGVVLLYLMLVDVRMPVLRAGVMTIAGSLGLVWGRRLRVSGLVSLSAILLLLWRPDQLLNAGFQLTFGVVLGLVHLAPRVRRRWFGPPQYEAQTVGEMISQCAKSALVVSAVAWLIATPIAAFHFGMIAPLGVPLSLIAVPLSAGILALGYLKIVLAGILPSFAYLVGIPLSVLADVLLAIVKISDSIPWSRAYVPHPSVLWTLLAVASVTWWGMGRGLRERFGLAQAAAFVLLIAWLLWPIRSANGKTDHVRIDMLAVGDGSCYVIRDGESTVVFDAGSSTDLNVGRRSLVPALRRLGVRSIDALLISHADLDHYSAVIEICDEFDVAQAMVTPQFVSEGMTIRDGPVAFLMQSLTQRRVAVQEVAAGQSRTLGRTSWTWLHPQARQQYARANEGSMVISLEHAGRRVLFCGDIQREAIRMLMASGTPLHADVLELPHHGSFDDAAAGFVQAVNASVIMQSTGWVRWKRDKWREQLADVERLVTVRDGACTVEIEPSGSMRISRFVETRDSFN